MTDFIKSSAARIGDMPSYAAYMLYQSPKWKKAGQLLNLIATPIAIAFSPVALVADLIATVAEICFMAYKREPKKIALAAKKFIVLPFAHIGLALGRLFKFLLHPLNLHKSYGTLQTQSRSWLEGIKISFFYHDFLSRREEMSLAAEEYADNKERQIVIWNGKSKTNWTTAEQTKIMEEAADYVNYGDVKPLDNRTMEEKCELLERLAFHTRHGFKLEKSEQMQLFGFYTKKQLNQQALKQAYNELALVFHPDKTPPHHGDDRDKYILRSSERFQALNTAYHTLSK